MKATKNHLITMEEVDVLSDVVIKPEPDPSEAFSNFSCPEHPWLWQSVRLIIVNSNIISRCHLIPRVLSALLKFKSAP